MHHYSGISTITHGIEMSEEQGNCLLDAAGNGLMDEVRQLLMQGANVSYKNGDGWTALHFASSRGHPQIVRLSLENGAAVDCKTKSGETPSMLAAQEGHKEVAEVLIEKGAKITKHNYDGDTSLHFASDWGHADIARLLIEKGASVDCKNKYGQTPLMRAAQGGHTGVAEVLIEKGAKLNERNNRGMTALHVASYWGQPETVKLLLNKGSTREYKDKVTGRTALDVAKDRSEGCKKDWENDKDCKQRQERCKECIKILTVKTVGMTTKNTAQLVMAHTKPARKVDSTTQNMAKLQLSPSKPASTELHKTVTTKPTQTSAQGATSTAHMPKISAPLTSSSNPAVFLSYNHSHKAVVHRLHQYLESQGFSCWIDVVVMKPGCNLLDEMLKGIRNAKVVIAFLSKNYLESKNCKRELQYADEFDKVVIPVRIEKVSRDDFKDSGLLRAVIPHHVLYLDMFKVGPNSSDDEMSKDMHVNSLVEVIEDIVKK